MKKIPLVLLVLSVLLLVVLLTVYSRRSKPEVQQTGSMRVVASFYPLYFFAAKIGGDMIDITNLTPPGAEPHDYEPSTGDLVTIQKSKLLIINGKGLEPWAEKIETDIGGSVRVISVSESLTGNAKDPHVWLDPVLAKAVARGIADALSDADPDNKNTYEANLALLTAKLDDLDAVFKTRLSSCDRREIVTSHAAFGYLSERYGLTQVSISGLSPDEEPSAQRLAEVSDLVKQKGIGYIFFETLVSSRLAETLARETGAEILVFNPLEGLTKEEMNQGEDYFSVQLQNLKNLQTALGCSEKP